MSQSRPAQLLMQRPHLQDGPAVRPLTDGYDVRTYQQGQDESSLAHVLAAAFASEWTVQRVREELTQAPDVLAVYVATWLDQPVATASSRWLPHLYPGSGYVHWVGTHPDYVRRGLGLAVMSRLLQDFRERGYRDAVLETDDFRLPAIKTYLRCGFLPVYDVNGEDHRNRWAAIFQKIFLPDGRGEGATSEGS